MKVRVGFVSNSSSSSFLIYGAEISRSSFSDPELYEKIIEEEVKVPKPVSLVYGPDCKYIGRSLSSIGDDETGRQFKESVEKAIEQIAGKKLPCFIHQEAWYDG